VKVESRHALREAADTLFESSDLLIAQEYVPTEYDWRVGIFNRVPLYVCRYYMARGHWQIMKHSGSGRVSEGRSTTVAVDDAPPGLIRAALRAAGLVGDGLYGVDLKEWQGKFYVIEINDNPSIDAGVEDAVSKDDLYRAIMREFLRRIEERKSKGRRA
jgi:glutathione synthase/RimK-type ligase-like ATP-grasp enzyme